MPRHISFSLLLALSLAVACSSGDAARPGGPAGRGGRGAGAVPVVTARVEQKAMPVTLPAVGTVEALATVEVRGQVTGQLSTIHFREGVDVTKGQPLFSLDARPFQAALLQAQAVLARDVATFKNSEAQQARIENLFQRGLVPREQLETQRAGTAALAATVEADRAVVENARINLQYTEIRSPISGRTGAFGVHVGDLVRANDTIPLVVINQVSPVYVSFSVPGQYLSDIRRYQAQKPLLVTAAVQAAGSQASPSAPALTAALDRGRTGGKSGDEAGDDGSAAHGSVSFIDNTVDPTTGTIRLKATFPNARRQLWPGAFVQVVLVLTTDQDALVVPAVAVQASQEGQYVYVVKPDRTVEMRRVKLERQQGDQAVIAQGVKANEIVVTDGHLRLTPGARVTERSGRGEGGERPAGGRGPAPQAAPQHP